MIGLKRSYYFGRICKTIQSDEDKGLPNFGGEEMKQVMQVFLMITIVLATSYSIYTNVFANQKIVKQSTSHAATNFSLTDLDGVEVKLEDFTGKGVILNFWASYCPPCKHEMPLFKAEYKKLQKQGIEIVSINAGEPTRVVNQYALKQALPFPVLVDRDTKVTQHFEVETLPTTLFITSEGVVNKKILGELSKEQLNEYAKSVTPK